MTDDEMEDLRQHVEQWAEDEGIADADMAAALRKLAREYEAHERASR
jgi:hypothetical protein